MDRQLTKKILNLQETALSDPEFGNLHQEYAIRNATLLDTLDTMTQIQRNAVLDYIGLGVQMHLQLVELALAKPEI